MFDQGTVFRLPLVGPVSTLVSFAGTNGSAPLAAPVLGNDGLLYGTCSGGGPGNGGTVFRVSTTGALTTLFAFRGSDGRAPAASLVLGTDQNFY